MFSRFQDRRDAGRQLARALKKYARMEDLTLLALPRGGVPVGYEVSLGLGASLHVFLVRKLGVPSHDEYAMGAMASGGVILLNQDVILQLRISDVAIRHVVERESRELQRREAAYGKSDVPLHVEGRTVILIDDGLATGSTMKVAVRAVRQMSPRKIIVAVPVAPPSAADEFKKIVDDFIAVQLPESFSAVGEWYKDFTQTTDDEVCEFLAKATGRTTPVPATHSSE